MGWLISVVMLIIASIHGNDVLMITSGLFAIAGSIGGGADMIKKAINDSTKKSKIDNQDLSFLD